jgi:hypothetical protein
VHRKIQNLLYLEPHTLLKINVAIISCILLAACASPPSKNETPSKTTSDGNKQTMTELILGVTADPNEKNPLMYELPGMWKLESAGDDCEKSWQEVRISYDKTTLSLTRVMKTKGVNIPTERTYFVILENGTDYLKLQTKFNQKPINEYWTLARKKSFFFAMRNSKTHEITPTYTRCTTIGVSFEGVIENEYFEEIENLP